jgi:hypothetical protein
MDFLCKDDPEANNRIPCVGDQRFTLVFPLENGETLRVHMGLEGFNTFTTFISQMMIDDNNQPN